MPRQRVFQIFIEVVVGIGIALVVAEASFRIRDHGAFPHVNFYVPDARLGVRLRPEARERLSFSGNPRTSLRTNSDGLRGAELAAVSADEIVVVGDSQVFGLGVEEDATFSAELGRTLHRPVVNAGVPTYGPAEYVMMIEDLLARRQAKTVIFTINLANDFFEASHPNPERHQVWDGWAVRKETAPARVFEFPGRRLLMAESHFVFALRRWLYARGPQIDERGFASEGTWTDLVGVGQQTTGRQAARRKEIREDVLREEGKRSQARGKLDVAESTLARVDAHSLGLERPADLGEIGGLEFAAARASVGDIVIDEDAEESRSIRITSAMIQRAAAYRVEFESRLRQHRARVTSEKARKRLDGQIGALDTWARSQKELAALQSLPGRFLRHGSPLDAHLAKAKEICDAHGARMVVLVLPLDVQVSPTEWAKYGRQPIDMAPTRILIDDLIRSVDELGVTSVDASAALAAAEPGAFLKGDLHMTAHGHSAVARALAAAVRSAPPPPFPTGGLQKGRTRLRESATSDNFVYLEQKEQDSLAAIHCAAYSRNEWVRLSCPGNEYDGAISPTGIVLESGGHGEGFTSRQPGWVGLTAPLLAGDKLETTVFWEKQRARIVFRLATADDQPTVEVRLEDKGKAAAPASPLEDRLSLCHLKAGGGETREVLWAAADPDCVRTYGDDCERLIECARRDPASPPSCSRGQANAGGTGRCYVLCDDRNTCAQGHCAPWSETGICE